MWARTFLKAFMLCKPWEYCYPYVKKDICNFFLVPNVLTVMQDIQKVKHIYFSYSWNLFIFEGSKRIWGWWIACTKPKSVWILNYCRWNTLFHFRIYEKRITYFSTFFTFEKERLSIIWDLAILWVSPFTLERIMLQYKIFWAHLFDLNEIVMHLQYNIW